MGNRLSRIYTRTGDDGTTGLGDGSRVRKDHARVEAYGTVDEANSAIGVILAVPGLPAEVARCLTEIQHDLFDLGGELCIPGTQVIKAEQIAQLEQVLDKFNDPLPPLKDFILPGGGPAAAALPPGTNHRAAGGTLRVDAGRSRAGQHRSAEVSEPAVGPAVRAGARARAPRERLRGSLAPRPRQMRRTVLLAGSLAHQSNDGPGSVLRPGATSLVSHDALGRDRRIGG